MSEIKEYLSTTGGTILAIEGWHCVCTVCGDQWFDSCEVWKEPPTKCNRCEFTKEWAEKSVKDFKKKVKEGRYKMNLAEIVCK